MSDARRPRAGRAPRSGHPVLRRSASALAIGALLAGLLFEAPTALATPGGADPSAAGTLARSRPVTPAIPATGVRMRVPADGGTAAGAFDPSIGRSPDRFDRADVVPGSEITELRTATSRTVVNADGTYSLSTTELPIHYQDATGAWQPIDLSLVADATAGHDLRVAAAGRTIRFGAGAAEQALASERQSRLGVGLMTDLRRLFLWLAVEAEPPVWELPIEMRQRGLMRPDRELVAAATTELVSLLDEGLLEVYTYSTATKETMPLDRDAGVAAIKREETWRVDTPGDMVLMIAPTSEGIAALEAVGGPLPVDRLE